MYDLDDLYNAGYDTQDSFVRAAMETGVSKKAAEAYYDGIHRLEMIGVAAGRSEANTLASVVLWLVILLFVAGSCYGLFAALVALIGSHIGG